MNIEEKLQLIDDARLKFVETIHTLFDVGNDISVDIKFYSTFKEYIDLLDAAKNLGWAFGENESRWYVSPHRFGDTTIFYK